MRISKKIKEFLGFTIALFKRQLIYLNTKGKVTWFSIVALIELATVKIKSVLKALWGKAVSIMKASFQTLNHPVFYSITITVLVVLIYRYSIEANPTLFFQNKSPKDTETMQRFIEWLGIPYGLLLSMILVRS